MKIFIININIINWNMFYMQNLFNFISFDAQFDAHQNKNTTRAISARIHGFNFFFLQKNASCYK